MLPGKLRLAPRPPNLAHLLIVIIIIILCAVQPLSVELGPGLLTTIFDGIQRPLKAIALSSGDCFIPRGVDVPALDRKKQWEFNPHKVKVSLLFLV